MRHGQINSQIIKKKKDEAILQANVLSVPYNQPGPLVQFLLNTGTVEFLVSAFHFLSFL